MEVVEEEDAAIIQPPGDCKKKSNFSLSMRSVWTAPRSELVSESQDLSVKDSQPGVKLSAFGSGDQSAVAHTTTTKPTAFPAGIQSKLFR